METEQLEELIKKIQQLQSIMIEVATGESRIEDEEEDYTELYREVALEIETLQEEALPVSNPNNFRSLWDWYRHWSSKLEGYASRRRYIHELYTSVINQIESVLYQYRTQAICSEALAPALDASDLQELLTKIQKLQSIMIEVATGGSRIEDEEEGYTKLYQKVALQVRHLQGLGLPIENPNNFRSLWHWHGHWSSQLDNTWAVRREYINNLYGSIVEPIESSLYKHRHKATSPEELVLDLKRRLNQQASAQTPSSQSSGQSDLRGNVAINSNQTVQRQPIKNRWALLVGINRYVDPNFPSLKFCVNDVQALEQTLKGLGYRVVCLHDQLNGTTHRLPTRNNIEAELALLCEATEPDDLLLVHFACHGKLDKQQQPVLITQDTRLSTLAKTGLPLAEIKQQMRQSQAKRLVLTLDACHTGVEIGRDIADPQFIRNAYELAEGFALIAASTAQQIAQEWGQKEHGVFTYYLLESFRVKADHDKKGFVTVDDLKNHVLNGLRCWRVEHSGAIQEPNAQIEGLGDMILADYRDRSQGDLL